MTLSRRPSIAFEHSTRRKLFALSDSFSPSRTLSYLDGIVRRFSTCPDLSWVIHELSKPKNGDDARSALPIPFFRAREILHERRYYTTTCSVFRVGGQAGSSTILTRNTPVPVAELSLGKHATKGRASPTHCSTALITGASHAIRRAIGDLVRQRLHYAIVCACPDGNDAARLGSDPTDKPIRGRDKI